jgi:hypothetical protein
MHHNVRRCPRCDGPLATSNAESALEQPCTTTCLEDGEQCTLLNAHAGMCLFPLSARSAEASPDEIDPKIEEDSPETAGTEDQMAVATKFKSEVQKILHEKATQDDRRNRVLAALKLAVEELLNVCETDNSSMALTFKSFMGPLVFFCTSTSVGLPLRMVLLFPPTQSYRKQDSLISKTIQELKAQQLEPKNISIVELFP